MIAWFFAAWMQMDITEYTQGWAQALASKHLATSRLRQ